MDITVTPAQDGKIWNLTDLLGRSMGFISENEAQKFTIHPDGHATETMSGLVLGPHASLDEALAKIETLTRGVCRLVGR